MLARKFVLFCIFALTLVANDNIVKPIYYVEDNLNNHLFNERVTNSHIKVFIPSIPYHYVSKLINGTLLRIADTTIGWEYMLATNYEKVDELTYDFTLRKEVLFQDGTPFNADSVVENFKAFINQPYTYTDVHNRLKSVEKLNDYKVRFHLHKPYGMFFHDLAAINIYSNEYLRKFAWKGGATGANTQEAGPYGLGPYILEDGYAVGLKQTPLVKLRANPYYYERGKPYIENITIYTQLTTNKAVDMVLNNEEMLDITPIPFNKKTEATLSPYAKLLTMPSTNNIVIYFNLIKPQGVLKNKHIRIALNKAINQPRLLNFIYKNEGKPAPTEASVNYTCIARSTAGMDTYGGYISDFEQMELKNILSGIELNVVTQDRFMFLWKGIEYQLAKYGVKLKYNITTSEKDIYEMLLTNRKEPKEWDMLTWGNDDWYGNHPWTTFFSYRTNSEWSAIDQDEVLQEYIEAFFYHPLGSAKFQESVDNIVRQVYDNAYMLFLPSPNLVLAINKEVYYTPSSVAIMPLWEAKISKHHWSVRENEYPRERLLPMKPQKVVR